MIASALGAGCSDGAELDGARNAKVIDSLRMALRATQSELDAVKFGAPRLLAAARAAVAAGRLETARDTATLLLTRHPESAEAHAARTMVTEVSAQIAARAAATERARRDSVAADEARRGRAVAGMIRMKDEVDGDVLYWPRWAGRYVNGHSAVLLYVRKPASGEPILFFSIRYTSDDWLFIQRYTIRADDRVIDYTPTGGYDPVERDNGDGGIWEWYTTRAGTEELALVRAILSSKTAKIRYVGKQYYRDRTIGADERAALQQALDAYAALGGT